MKFFLHSWYVILSLSCTSEFYWMGNILEPHWKFIIKKEECEKLEGKLIFNWETSPLGLYYWWREKAVFYFNMRLKMIHSFIYLTLETHKQRQKVQAKFNSHLWFSTFPKSMFLSYNTHCLFWKITFAFNVTYCDEAVNYTLKLKWALI